MSIKLSSWLLKTTVLQPKTVRNLKTQTVFAQEGGSLIGAAVTQEELIDFLLSSCSREDDSAKSSMSASGCHLPRDCPNGQPKQLPSCPNGQPEQPQANR